MSELNSNNKLTEKQLRKLEWDKKLLEQKSNSNEKTFTKAELKAKRREQQEAQRLAKKPENNTLNAKKQQQQTPEKIGKLSSNNMQKNDDEITTEVKKSLINKKTQIIDVKSVSKQVQLVKHLYRAPSDTDYTRKVVNFKDIHPSFIKLGVQYKEKIILGSNARALGLLAALKCLINDIQTPPKQEFSRYLQGVLQSCTNYLQNCRSFAVSMTNVLKEFNLNLRHINTSLSDNEKKTILLEFIDTFIRNDIRRAWDAISLTVNKKIVNGDVILIYACSSLIKQILFDAFKDGKKFSVILVDSRPLLEGREMLRQLIAQGIKCNYILINGISGVMKQVTKVLLGAHALLTNGSVMSRIGTAQIALVAQAYNKPVLVCCETYKFSERVQTDAFVYNEIGDSELLFDIDTLNTPSPLLQQKENSKLNILNLLYDVTPPDLVTAVVTELAILPCTSVPVVLRIHAELLKNQTQKFQMLQYLPLIRKITL